MDVTFPPGTTYILVIDTDAYSGNFERQICGFTTGIVDDDRYHGIAEAEATMAAYPISHAIRAKGTTVPHEEYGDVSNTIRPTPGRLNNGMGEHFDAAPGQKGWPAYESVAIFFKEPLTADEMAFVRQRAAEYAATQKSFGGEPEPFTIRDVYMVKVEVAETEARLDI